MSERIDTAVVTVEQVVRHVPFDDTEPEQIRVVLSGENLPAVFGALVGQRIEIRIPSHQ